MSKNNNNIKDTHDIKDYALDIGTVDSFQGSGMVVEYCYSVLYTSDNTLL